MRFWKISKIAVRNFWIVVKSTACIERWKCLISDYDGIHQIFICIAWQFKSNLSKISTVQEAKIVRFWFWPIFLTGKRNSWSLGNSWQPSCLTKLSTFQGPMETKNCCGNFTPFLEQWKFLRRSFRQKWLSLRNDCCFCVLWSI